MAPHRFTDTVLSKTSDFRRKSQGRAEHTMKLTGWFSQDKITDNSKVQTTDTQNAEQVSRQIRTLVPGQTIRGEVVSREGNNAQIRLLQDVLIDARVDADIRLDLGQNITFQVKNNGQVLSLSPLFTNMATEGTVLKALEMASLPTNESTVAMTKQLMDAGFPIDKNTLQQIWHESNVFPEAAIEDIVNLHRLELPVTEENLTQMASYRNLTYQLTEGITAVAESLNSTLQGLTTNGEIEQAATIYGHILELLIPGEENPEVQRATVQFPDSEQTETVLQPGETMSQTKEAIAHTDTAVTNGTPEASKTMLPTQKMIVDGTKPEDAAEVVLKLLKQGLATKDTALLRSVLQNFKIAGLPGELLQDAWSIRPEDVESSEKVEELYQKLGKQLKSLAGLLEENGQSSSNAFQAVTNLSRNVDFLQQINQTYAYIQLPLHLRQGEHKTGELFVYTNKKNLAGKDGRVSALLHLDMEHLGPLDVYVALQDTKVSTKFYVQNDTILDYLEANMEVLTQRLKQRGYVCNCETTLRTELQQTAQAMAPILKAGGSVPVAQYAFDVRT
ncbi:flagellar hook-length control protein FliK [Firmicutes bacterium AF22-6AC]|nr:flagellar hook-length control protein FliK [Firmicutes bacterium AF22-6AC]